MATLRSMLIDFLAGRATQPSDERIWIRDPLRHPSLARMDQRELGDLPMSGFARPGPVAVAASDAVLPAKPQHRLPPAGEKLRRAC